MIIKIISGGQTGSDLGALQAAHKAGLMTGGYAPKDFWTEKGANPELATKYYLIDSHGNYPHRTRLNVRRSDGTLIVGKLSVGSLLTKSYAREYGKPYLWIKRYNVYEATEEVLEWLARNRGIVVLNVAGNRESQNPGIGEFVEELILSVLMEQKAQVTQ